MDAPGKGQGFCEATAMTIASTDTIDPQQDTAPTWSPGVNGGAFKDLVARTYQCQEALGEDAGAFVDLLHKRIAAALDAQALGPAAAWELLTEALPAHHLEEALLGTGPALPQRLLACVSPMLPRMMARRLPSRIFGLSYPAFARLQELGLRYGEGMDPKEAAKRWLCCGAPYGKAAWTARHPRSNPFMAFWAEHGLTLPGMAHHLPLRAEAREETLALAVQAVHQIGKRRALPQPIADTIAKKAGHWSVGLALLRAGLPPHALSYTGATSFKIFPEPWRKAIVPMFSPDNVTAHAVLLHKSKLAAMPDVATLLAQAAGPAPATLHEALGFPPP